jgi:hypothetical protein
MHRVNRGRKESVIRKVSRRRDEDFVTLGEDRPILFPLPYFYRL